MTKHGLISVAALLPLWIGCKSGHSPAADGAVSPPDSPPDSAPPAPVRKTVVELPVTLNRDLDLLFVIDDSPSMLDKQVNLSNVAGISLGLQTLPGGLPNLHLGVISSDMGTKASGSATPGPAIGQVGNGGCSGAGKGGALQTGVATLTGKFLVDVEQPGGGRMKNYTGELGTAFGQMIRLGAGGCGFEQTLAAMRAALDNHPSNTGFLRAGANLGVIVLSDEDDCSVKSTELFGPDNGVVGPLLSFRCTRFGVTCAGGGQTSDAMNQVGAKTGCAANASSPYVDDVAPYRDFLAGLKTGGRRVAVGVIAGAAEPFAVELRQPPGGGAPVASLAHSCAYQGSIGPEVADPPARLKSLLDGLPGSTSLSTICEQNLTASLGNVVQTLRQAMEGACVETRLADAAPGTPGLQADCIVEDVVGAAATPVPACEASPAARPCWQLQPDPAACAVSPAPNLKLVVQRAAAADPSTITRARCLVAP